MAEAQSFAAIHERLEAERAELQSQMETFPITVQDQSESYGADNHPADEATDMFLRERNLALRNTTQERIVQIDAALKRMEEGTYGICTRCGNPINEERLEALPYATLCINCQSIVERESGGETSR